MRKLLLLGSMMGVFAAAQANADRGSPAEEQAPQEAPEERSPAEDDTTPPADAPADEPSAEEETPTAGDDVATEDTAPTTNERETLGSEPEVNVDVDVDVNADVPDAETDAPAADADATGELSTENELEAIRTPVVRRSRARAKPSESECLAPAVWVARAEGERRELRRLSLTDCDGKPNLGALDELSILARPHGVDRPADETRPNARNARRARRLGPNVAPDIIRLHPGLMTRLQRVADQWPGRRIEIVSGYRPQARRTSRHHHGEALDMRVVGVSKEAVTRFARSMEATGVGYYPNSSFTHLDVRAESAYWVDRSAAGQPANYGRAAEPVEKAQADNCQADLTAALARITQLVERLEAAAVKFDTRTSDPLASDPPPATSSTAAESDVGAPASEATPATLPEGEIPTIDWTPPDTTSPPPPQVQEAPAGEAPAGESSTQG